MFDGKTRSRHVSLGGKRSDNERNDLLRKARESRENRAKDREKQFAAAKIAKVIRSRFIARKAREQVKARYSDKMAKFRTLSTALAAAHQVFYPPRELVWQMIAEFLFAFNPLSEVDLLPDFKRLLLVAFAAPETQNILSDCLRNAHAATMYEWRLSRVLRVLLNDWVTQGDEHPVLSEGAVECIALMINPAQWHGFSIEESSAAISKIVGSSLHASQRLGVQHCVDDIFTTLRRHIRHAQCPKHAQAERLVEQRLEVLVRTCVIAVSWLSDAADGTADDVMRVEHYRRFWGRFALSVLATSDFGRLPGMLPLTEYLQQQGDRVWVNALQGAVLAQTQQPASEINKGALIRLATNAFASQLIPEIANQRHKLQSRESEEAVVHFLGHVFSALPIVRILRMTEAELEEGVKSPLNVGVDEDTDEDESLTRFTHGGVAALELTMNFTQRQLARLQQAQFRSIAASAQDATQLLQSLLDHRLVASWFEIVQPPTSTEPAIISTQDRKRAKYLGDDFEDDPVPQLCMMYGQLIMALPLKQITNRSDPLCFAGSTTAVLNALAFGSPNSSLVTRLWGWIAAHLDVAACGSLVRHQARGNSTSAQSASKWASSVFSESAMPIAGMLYIFFLTFAHHLITVDDEEFYAGSPLPLTEVITVTRMLKDLLFRLYWTHPVLCPQLLLEPNSGKSLSPLAGASNGDQSIPLFDTQFILAATRLYNQLAERNDRRNFLDQSEWLWSNIQERDLDLAMTHDDFTFSSEDTDDFNFRDPRVRWIVNSLPQVIPFAQRAKIFQQLLENDRSNIQQDGFGPFASAQLHVRRDQLYEDAYAEMNALASRLKGRVQVTFVSEHGYQEAGIDGGGVFKEFMDTLTHRAFDITYGLFTATSENMLVPNPGSDLAHNDHLAHFEFVGRVLGKAMYEQILIEPVFAKVFLNILLGRVNHIDDLFFLDSELYRSLLKMKHMPEQGKDVSTLELFFETTTHRYGETKTVELIPGGSSVRVTNSNVINYIHRLANYKLNVETAPQSQALLRGFRDLIPVGWIRMFSAHELQLLIGGDLRPIDVDNMRRSTRYGGGYHDSQPYIQHFWDIVASMSPQQQSDLLKFVTSCSRQPLLGFEQLSPPFCIQEILAHPPASAPHSSARLPTASTCMNLLKLPRYESAELLREKLLYAITQANTGFELS